MKKSLLLAFSDLTRITDLEEVLGRWSSWSQIETWNSHMAALAQGTEPP